VKRLNKTIYFQIHGPVQTSSTNVQLQMLTIYK